MLCDATSCFNSSHLCYVCVHIRSEIVPSRLIFCQYLIHILLQLDFLGGLVILDSYGFQKRNSLYFRFIKKCLHYFALFIKFILFFIKKNTNNFFLCMNDNNIKTKTNNKQLNNIENVYSIFIYYHFL